jgi:AraC-like DNA-binding protein
MIQDKLSLLILFKNMSYSFSELFNYFGGLLGIILAIILLTTAKGSFHVRINLALYLIIGSIIIILGAITFSGKILSLPHLLRIDSPLHFLFIPIGFFFVYSELKPGFKFKWIYFLNFIPFMFDLVWFVPFYMKDAAYKTAYYNTFISTTGSIVMPLQYILKSVMGLIYFSLQIYIFFKYKPKVSLNSAASNSKILWFWIFLSGEGIAIAGMLLDQASGHSLFSDPFRFSVTMVGIYIYDIVLALMFFPSMLYGNPDLPVGIPGAIPLKEKYGRSTLNDEEKAGILLTLLRFLENTEKPYLNPKLSLPEVSSILDITTNNLSQVINEKTGLNFNDYINSYRVEEAKRILSSFEYQKLTIDAIAKKAGFNSRSPFYNAFKKHTGMTPKEFAAIQKLPNLNSMNQELNNNPLSSQIDMTNV